MFIMTSTVIELSLVGEETLTNWMAKLILLPSLTPKNEQMLTYTTVLMCQYQLTIYVSVSTDYLQQYCIFDFHTVFYCVSVVHPMLL